LLNFLQVTSSCGTNCISSSARIKFPRHIRKESAIHCIYHDGILVCKLAFHFGKNNFLFIFNFIRTKQRFPNCIAPEFKPGIQTVGRHREIVIHIFIRGTAVPLTNTKVIDGTLNRRSIAVQGVSFEHHVLIQMEQPCVFLCLRNATSLHRNFYVCKRSRMVFHNKQFQSVVKFVLIQIFNRSFFSCANCDRQKQHRDNKKSDFLIHAESISVVSIFFYYFAVTIVNKVRNMTCKRLHSFIGGRNYVRARF